MEIRQQGAVQFKNFVKYNWNPEEGQPVPASCVVSDEEKVEIKTHIVDLMLKAPDRVRAQISESLTIISTHDFPEKWDLLPNILQKFNTDDVKALNGVLSTTDSIFHRYRGQFMTAALSRELQYCQPIIRPLLAVMQFITSKCEELASAAVTDASAQSATVVLDDARLVLNIYYSLNSPGLTDELEDTMKEWMDCIHRVLVLQMPCLSQLHTDGDEESSLDAMKAIACECLSLHMELNEEEFEKFLEVCVGDVWKQLLDVGPGLGQDSLAMAAISFLTTVARSVHFKLFAGEDILKQVCQGVIIPNIRLREGDVELFEMNWVEYVRRDTEGSDSDTRRRAASELVKALVEKFPSQTTELFSGYVSALLQEDQTNPAGAWQAKDAAIYLVTALAAKTKTSTAGATSTNALVNLTEFYSSHVAPELQDPNTDARTIVKADCMRFVTVFRSQLPRETMLEMFPKCISYLTSSHNVVHSYAATLVERLLAMKVQGKPVFTASELGSYLQPLLENLFSALRMPDSGENEYVMKAVMRLIAFVGKSVVPVAVPALQQLAVILGNVARNPTQPGFNHYLFESIAALVKNGNDGTEASISSIEGILFPPFQIILQEDVQEFHPYLFQVYAELLEIRGDICRGSAIPDSYMQLLQPLLTPHFWERPGNIPALGRLIRTYINVSPKQTESQLQGILGVFQKLIASKNNDHEGMLILDYVLGSFEPDVMNPLMSSIWSILYQRLQSARTAKFSKSFIATAGQFAALRGGSAAGESMDSVQPGILAMLVESVWAPTLAAPGILVHEKATIIGSTRLLCEYTALQAPHEAPALLLHAIAMRVSGQTSVHPPAQEGSDEVEEFVGYSAAYAKLYHAAMPEKDWMASVVDMKAEVAQRLTSFNSQYPGKLMQLIQSLPPEHQEAVRRMLTQLGIH